MSHSINLTRYPLGSIRELWTISMPLMISILASLVMVFTDRVFLAHYSIDALNAVVNAGTLSWALMSGFGMVAAMSEVFVAQYNGAGEFKRIGRPVWQMIWFALFSFVFFIPMGIWGAPAIFGEGRLAGMEIDYFRIQMFLAPLYVLFMAFVGFFVGRGKTHLMIWLAIFSNMVNITLDRALIFGVPGFIPEMGVQGAAVATFFGYLFETAVLAYLFLRPAYRVSYETSNYKLNWEEMKRCCKIGFPQGFFTFMEVFSWALFYWMMTSLSDAHIVISSICQSFLILLSFFYDGLMRGAAALAGNFIGAKRYDLVYKVLRSAIVHVLFFSLVVSTVLVFNPIGAAKLLFFSTDAALAPSLEASLRICMICSAIYLFFDGLRWVLGGLLTAAGDTLFLWVSGTISVSVLLLAPVYWFVVRNRLDVEYAWALGALYAALFCLMYWIRFASGKWQDINLVPSQTKSYTSSQKQELDPPGVVSRE